ncbi:uncharacterized protein [Heterodontus francisci]|uniref:uncharacterized protein n=1 Tax=Heterodontus francisci TaxID=7792 RepID=UPI00355BD7E3
MQQEEDSFFFEHGAVPDLENRKTVCWHRVVGLRGVFVSSKHKMALLFGIAIVCTCIVEVQCLTCLTCNALARSCTTARLECAPEITSCVTISSTTTVGGLEQIAIAKACGNCPDAESFNAGFMKSSTKCSSCNSSLCNNQPFEEADTRLNGLQCFGNSPEAKDGHPIIVKCTGIEVHCIETSIKVPSLGTVIEINGCASKNLCQTVETSQLGIEIIHHPNCCEDNLCNKGRNLPGSGIWLSILTVVAVTTLL